MALRKRKKKITIRFELGLWGIFSLGVICFCIFLWMFLLGIWAGQTVFEPDSSRWGALSKFTASLQQPDNHGEDAAPEKYSPPPEDRAPAAQQQGPDWTESDPSYFSLQVGAFNDPAHAEKAVENWRGRGYDTFLQPPDEDDDSFTRVFIGKFEKLSDANQLAERLESQENVKAYIALLPASRIKLP
jgi:hypothetical protein